MIIPCSYSRKKCTFAATASIKAQARRTVTRGSSDVLTAVPRSAVSSLPTPASQDSSLSPTAP